jgi:hypothetical protein
MLDSIQNVGFIPKSISGHGNDGLSWYGISLVVNRSNTALFSTIGFAG